MHAIDTHAHLDFPEYNEDRHELISKLAKQEVGVITISTSLESVAKVVDLARNNSLIWCAIGLHPTDVGKDTLTKLPALLDEWKDTIRENKKVVAIGEIGLDYFRSTEGTGIQTAALRQLLTFAQEMDLPVIFHCRDAYGDLATLLKDYEGLQGVIHCYNGTYEQAKKFLDLGYHLSFTGMITYKANEELRKIARDVPIDRLLLETDSPFLSPQSRRGTRNDPFSILEIANLHAEQRNISRDEILKATTRNAEKLFKLQVP